MYWFDTALLALLTAGTLMGAYFGFVGQIARIVCVSLAGYGAVIFHEPVAEFLQECLLKDANPRVADILAHVVIFVVAFMLLFYAARLVRQGVREADLIGYDRLLGAMLGGAKMALVLGAVCLGMMNYRHPTTEAILEKSQLAESFADGMERVVVMIPEEYKTRLREGVFNLRDQVTSAK